MTQMAQRVVALAVVMLTASVAGAQDWPAFRGPTGQGHSSLGGLPLEWSETDGVVWKSPVPGRGWSSPVVADGRVWLTTATAGGGGSLRVLAYDIETGQELLDTEVFRVDETSSPNPKNSLASPTPIIDVVRDRVFVHFGADGTAALTTAGDIIWSTHFPYVTQHGNGGSPVLHDGRLYLSVDGYDTAYVVALDAATGEEQWRTPRRNPISQRPRPALQHRGVSSDRVRPGVGRRDLGGVLWRRVLERAGAGLRTRHGLRGDRFSSAVTDRRARRRCR